MTKKDYIKIAEALKKVKEWKDDNGRVSFQDVLLQLEKVFEADNSRFNWLKFEEFINK